MHDKLWISNQIPDIEADSIAREAGISRLMAKVFLNRGMGNAEEIAKFLNPSLEDMYDPFLLKDMDKAVDRIIAAIDKGEKIVVYGDYDVDGVTSTSVLIDFLYNNGADAEFYIPDRIDEGYGISTGAVDKIKELGASLIVTVDCGITAFDEVKYINEKGMDVIITDHHECKDALPEAYAVIDPCRTDCPYPFKELAGVGVVYKLVNALCERLDLGDLYHDYLDMVALGTVADVVPLTDENRIIARFGIREIENTSNLGLRTLIDNSGLGDKPVTSTSIGYIIAPRINAAGRIGDAGRAVRLFTTSDEDEARKIALEFNDENKYRQDMEADILRQALELIETQADRKTDKVIVVSGRDWHHGVIGIVASKITDRYYRPCILLSEEEGKCKGSGRSIEGFNLFKALNHCEALLDKYGGHELAAGLSIKQENVDAFRKMINSYADSVLNDSDLMPRVKIDAYVSADDMNYGNVKELEQLAPFGAGNPGPVFAYNGFRIKDIRGVGDNKHIKLWLGDGNFFIEAIGFNMGGCIDCFNHGDLTDVVFSLEINTWNSVQKVQMNLKDMKLNRKTVKKNNYFLTLDKCIVSGQLNDYNKDNELLEKLESLAPDADEQPNCRESGRNLLERRLREIIPERQDLVAVYQYMKVCGIGSLLIDSLFVFAGRIADSYKIDMNYFKLKKSIEIFEELGLLKISPVGEVGMAVTLAGKSEKEKVSLDNSALYRRLQALKKRVIYN